MEWREGFLLIASQDTLRGKIKYDLTGNTVQIATSTRIMALSSYKVFYFEIFDEVYRNYRHFYTIPFKLRSNYEAPVIFEVLFEGPLSLLAREKIVQETINNNSPFLTTPRFTQDALDYDFYFLTKKGRITYYQGSRNELLEIMASKSTQVKEYIKTNRLRTDQVEDLIRITSFYNSI
jgi:hypothetical protein